MNDESMDTESQCRDTSTGEDSKEKAQTKIFNDCIHGHIELHPLCVKIIDTPEFQRLRFIKHIGKCYYVYPGASHNRFEHSLGVCHLAGELVETLRKGQPKLQITDNDVLCVKIAGLCNNLGQGPFSLLYKDSFLAHYTDKQQRENISSEVFSYLIDKNELSDEFKIYNLTEDDITFIKEQISGQNGEKPSYKGRGEEKRFLYEIVANKRNGIDVERWDYLARDCCMLGIQNSFDYKRFLKYARVIKVDGESQICTRDKQSTDIYDMFYTSKKLMERAYQQSHRNYVANWIYTFGFRLHGGITDAMVKANDHLAFIGSDGNKYKMSEAINDISAFMQLTDDVIFNKILYATDENLTESKEILTRVLKRQFYPTIAEAVSQKGQVYKKEEEQNLIRKIVGDCCCNKSQENVSEEELVVDIVDTHYGMKKDNPIKNVRFYSKLKPDKGVLIPVEQVSLTWPKQFDDQKIRIYAKTGDKKKIETLNHLFQNWCSKNQFTVSPI